MFDAEPHRFLVPFNGGFEVAKAPTAPPKNTKSHERPDDVKDALDDQAKRLGEAQHRLYSRGTHSLLIVLQALDAAGKDGVIRHVFGRVNPSGLQVASFRAPTALEAAHDFLWRTTAELPAHGHMAVFNRSYYEEVLVVRVHPEFLAAQNLPRKPGPELWADRCRAIVAHERHLAEQGTVILKFFLNVSKDEQRSRLLERIDDPEKRWKFRMGDIDERAHWDAYLEAYEQCLNATSRPWAPWYAVPADDKHYMRWQIAKIVNVAFEQIDLGFPEPGATARAELARGRERLLGDD